MIASVLSFLSNWQTKLIILVIILSGAFVYHKVEVNKAVTNAVSEIELNLAKENFRLKERSLDAQIALQNSFDNIQKEKDAKIKTLNARVASLTRSLQERPSRPESSGISNDSRAEEGKSGGTGTGLYREDSEFLLGEATRAELIKGELLSCYKSYDTAKAALDKYKKENTPKTD